MHEKKSATLKAQGKMCLRRMSQKNLTYVMRNSPQRERPNVLEVSESKKLNPHEEKSTMTET
ncbi:hypothetical protein BHM03_00034484 [Ensete ventricosum]|nr:hypothetical protein BHM03_00034484 [Ensete ventricosum]